MWMGDALTPPGNKKAPDGDTSVLQHREHDESSRYRYWMLSIFWWRRGESNSRPRKVRAWRLQV